MSLISGALTARVLDQRANVYTPSASTKEYTVLARAGLPCRLMLPSIQMSGVDPSIGQPTRRLYWLESYTLPHDCQVEIGGTRYQVGHGSEYAPTFRGQAAYHSADLVRAEGQVN